MCLSSPYSDLGMRTPSQVSSSFVMRIMSPISASAFFRTSSALPLYPWNSLLKLYLSNIYECNVNCITYKTKRENKLTVNHV